jgi:hypothetical protein
MAASLRVALIWAHDTAANLAKTNANGGVLAIGAVNSALPVRTADDV